MKTIKLYDTDAYISEFKATVLSCNKDGDLFDIVLDKTAFFPEGGGQPADIGTVGCARVLDVQINNNVIIHKADSPFEVGSEVNCKIDWNTRFRRMQNHTGEHIVSGIANRLYGCTNVGFHMGNEITVDFDIELSDEQIADIETLSNDAVYKNVSVTAEYPTSDVLKNLEYRSKLDLTEDVRIVTIDGYDKCACCAPHVKQSGEVGVIKILDSMRHRGGTRLFIICGKDAFEDYCVKTKNLYEIAVKLCAKHNEELEAFNRLCNENSELKQKCSSLSKELTQLKSQNVETVNGVALIFEKDSDMQTIRNLALETAKKNGFTVAVFSGADENFKYALSSMNESVRELGAKLNSMFNGRGGGSDELVQGSISADESAIRHFFNNL